MKQDRLNWSQLIQLKALDVASKRYPADDALREEVKEQASEALLSESGDPLGGVTFWFFSVLPFAIAALFVLLSSTVVPVYVVLIPPLLLCAYMLLQLMARKRSSSATGSVLFKIVKSFIIHPLLTSANNSDGARPHMDRRTRVYEQSTIEVLSHHPRYWLEKSLFIFSVTLLLSLPILFFMRNREYNWSADAGIKARYTLVRWTTWFLPESEKPSPYELAWTDPKNRNAYLVHPNFSGPFPRLTVKDLQVLHAESEVPFVVQSGSADAAPDTIVVSTADKLFLASSATDLHVPAKDFRDNDSWAALCHVTSSHPEVKLQVARQPSESGSKLLLNLYDSTPMSPREIAPPAGLAEAPRTSPELELSVPSPPVRWSWSVPADLLRSGTSIHVSGGIGDAKYEGVLSSTPINIGTNVHLIDQEEPENLRLRMIKLFTSVILVYSVLPRMLLFLVRRHQLESHRRSMEKLLQPVEDEVLAKEQSTVAVQVYTSEQAIPSTSQSNRRQVSGPTIIFVYNRGHEEAEKLRAKLALAHADIYPYSVSGGNPLSHDKLLADVRTGGFGTVIMGIAGKVQRDDQLKRLISSLEMSAELLLYDTSKESSQQIAAWKQQLELWGIANVRVHQA